MMQQKVGRFLRSQRTLEICLFNERGGVCNQRTQTDGFAEQNVRDAERAD